MSYYKGMPSHDSVLIFFRENPGKEFAATEVSQEICLSKASVSMALRFLVAKGHLTRRPVNGIGGTKYLYILKEETPKSERCKGLLNTLNWPYSKRCENDMAIGEELCQQHIDAGYEL